MYYEEDLFHDDRCNGCCEKKNALDDIRYWLKDMLKHLYSKSVFNEDEFERSLEEVCRSVDLKIPVTELQIQRKEEFQPSAKIASITNEVNQWILHNNNYLKALANN